jgi:hypothetical protein
VPAEELIALNDHILGAIELIRRFPENNNKN